MAAKTILLTDHYSYAVDNSRLADAALTPGELVELKSDGDYQPHATAGDKAAPWFVMENELAGEGIGTDITAGDRVPVARCRGGAQVYAFLEGESATAVIGSYLESAGNGNLRVHVPQDDTAATGSPTIRVGQIIAVAEEAVTPAGTGARSRIVVTII